jgi:hypothetical protein
LAKSKEETSNSRTRSDGRRQLLIYLLPDVIKELKRAALDDGRPAYVVAEEAILAALRSRKRKK